MVFAFANVCFLGVKRTSINNGVAIDFAALGAKFSRTGRTRTLFLP
jgi:hypothetical protein